jgi:hypothetical protein
MEFPFVYQYALSKPFLTNQTRAIIPNVNSSSISSTTKNALRALVLPDSLSFASAMWFYTQSGAQGQGCLEMPGMVQGLQQQSESGWENYITNCVGTTVTQERKQVYLQTLTILNGN